MNKEFNDLVEKFKVLSTDEKRKILVREFKMNVAAIEQINKYMDIKHELLINKELTDVDKPTATEDDFLEAYFVYLHMINDAVTVFAEKVSTEFFE